MANVNKKELVLIETESVTTHAKEFDGRAPHPETTTTSKTTILTTEAGQLDDVHTHLEECEAGCKLPKYLYDKKAMASPERMALFSSNFL
jgi:hypothetical protein